jgi:2-oxoglutarate/2-oxoacid ferredoxin oxidoreductase subunit alpha
MNDLIIGMAGSGGDGIVSAGESLISAVAAEGYFAMLTKSFGPQIRGGESSCRLRVSTTPVLNPGGELDVAVVLNWEDFLCFGSELTVTPDTIIIFEQKSGFDRTTLPLGALYPKTVCAVPMEEMAMKAAGTEKAKNNVILGLLAGWLGLEPESILGGIRKSFARKGEAVLQGNERAFAAGLEYAGQHPIGQHFRLDRPLQVTNQRVISDGNELCAKAAIEAGCKFFGGYPITPATEIMQHLQRDIWAHGGCVLQAEDEIAGIAAALGASFAGKKAMTATSGPGLSLKTEVLGLASVTELPLVCVNVQRGGPSTGMPTKREQADLFAAVFSAHGDSVRPVLAPVSVADTFAMTVEAFNLAEQYQTPVILLSDQELAQRKEIVDPVDVTQLRLVERREPTTAELVNYTRFRLTKTGVSPLSHPGMKGGNYLAAGIEHDERGAPTAKGELHALMNDKRLAKFNPLKKRRDLFVTEGDADAALAVIAWGSVAGIALEGVRKARAEGLEVKLLVPKLLYPIAEDLFAEFFASVRRCVVVEQSHQGQLHRLIRMWVNVPPQFTAFAKSGANPITPDEIVVQIRAMARAAIHRSRRAVAADLLNPL